MNYKFHLGDSCEEFQSLWRYYIDCLVENENKKLVEEIEGDIYKVINNFLIKRIGRYWEKIVLTHRNIIDFYPFSFSPLRLKEYCLSDKIRILGISHYNTKKRYPNISDIYENLVLNDLDKEIITDKIIELIDCKYLYFKELVDKGVLCEETGEVLPKTWEQMNSICPNILEWRIERILKENTIDRVEIIPVEKDLEDLKKWIMI